MTVDNERLAGWLSRLQLTAIRDQLDNLIEEAARREMTLREALAFLVEREISRKEERSLEMAGKIAPFPQARDLDGFDFSAQPSEPHDQTNRGVSFQCCQGSIPGVV